MPLHLQFRLCRHIQHFGKSGHVNRACSYVLPSPQRAFAVSLPSFSTLVFTEGLSVTLSRRTAKSAGNAPCLFRPFSRLAHLQATQSPRIETAVSIIRSPSFISNASFTPQRSHCIGTLAGHPCLALQFRSKH
ncbi:hypothetical protein TRVL_06384 [Trypanosoma vivax]|nr:hypothetical protein TRVL_06384 [Trypanosoma vivax]